jgi:hypothetical protein
MPCPLHIWCGMLPSIGILGLHSLPRSLDGFRAAPHPNSVSFYRWSCPAALPSLPLLLTTVLTDSVIYICCDATGCFLLTCCIVVFCTLWPNSIITVMGCFPPEIRCETKRTATEVFEIRGFLHCCTPLPALLCWMAASLTFPDYFLDWAVFHGMTAHWPVSEGKLVLRPPESVRWDENNRLNCNTCRYILCMPLMRPPSRLCIYRSAGQVPVTSNTVVPPSRSVLVRNETNLSRPWVDFHQVERAVP